MPDALLTWVTRSDSAVRLGRVVRTLASLGFVVALAVVIATLVTGRSAHWADWLLAPGIPVLILGQLWLIAVQQARLRPMRRSSRWGRRFSSRDVREAQLGGLPAGQRRILYAVGIATGVIAVTSYPDFLHFHPSPQRFTAAWFMAFYAVHAAVSSSELARREAEQSASGGYSTT